MCAPSQELRECLDMDNNIQTLGLLVRAGMAAGLALLLRSTPWHAAHRRIYIPAEIAAKHGLSPEEIYTRETLEATTNSILEMASMANAHLEKARSTICYCTC